MKGFGHLNLIGMDVFCFVFYMRLFQRKRFLKQGKFVFFLIKPFFLSSFISLLVVKLFHYLVRISVNVTPWCLGGLQLD